VHDKEKELIGMGQEQSNPFSEKREPVHMQAELPTEGTPLNPVEEAWAFGHHAAAAPGDKLANSMQQGE
jgi:hypothetical protein